MIIERIINIDELLSVYEIILTKLNIYICNNIDNNSNNKVKKNHLILI